jgi:5-methylcytosine-specific restriction endonuclease McrA
MVYVIDKRGKPLSPCSEKRARQLLEKKRAVVHKTKPFCIRMKDRYVEESVVNYSELRIDPGSKVSGVAAVTEKNFVILLSEIIHKTNISEKLSDRSSLRKSRRNRKTGYRQPRWNNRKSNLKPCRLCGNNTPKRIKLKNNKIVKLPKRDIVCRPCLAKVQGDRKKLVGHYIEPILSPSLRARVDQTIHVVSKLSKLLPINSIATEHVKFDTQLMTNPDLEGTDYQQGELYGYEVKEYLLERWSHTCAYCRVKVGVASSISKKAIYKNLSNESILEVEHVYPRNPLTGKKRGSNSIKNLVIACNTCNKEKNNKDPYDWLEELKKSKKKINKQRAINLEKVLKGYNGIDLRDAAVMNATRWHLYHRFLKDFSNIPVRVATGAQTKFNRISQKLPKEHYYDASCVAKNDEHPLLFQTNYVQKFIAMGRGKRKMANTDKYGFPISHRSNQKMKYGFITGDFVKITKDKGKYKGNHTVRITTRSNGRFYTYLVGRSDRFEFSYKECSLLQRGDGWDYKQEKRVPIMTTGV